MGVFGVGERGGCHTLPSHVSRCYIKYLTVHYFILDSTRFNFNHNFNVHCILDVRYKGEKLIIYLNFCICTKVRRWYESYNCMRVSRIGLKETSEAFFLACGTALLVCHTSVSFGMSYYGVSLIDHVT